MSACCGEKSDAVWSISVGLDLLRDYLLLSNSLNDRVYGFVRLVGSITCEHHSASSTFSQRRKSIRCDGGQLYDAYCIMERVELYRLVECEIALRLKPSRYCNNVRNDSKERRIATMQAIASNVLVATAQRGLQVPDICSTMNNCGSCGWVLKRACAYVNDEELRCEGYEVWKKALVNVNDDLADSMMRNV
nr:hypothetical protein Iba_chr12cCG24540 [Ipomoea batatas]